MNWEWITETPWWVYLLLLYLLKVGFDATKPSVISLKKLLILPLVFLALSLHTLLTATHLSLATSALFLASLLVGIGAGWFFVRNLQIKFDLKRGLIEQPGTWTTLFFISVVFATKYYIGYSLSMDPSLAGDFRFECMQLASSSLSAGLFLGRVACYLQKRRFAIIG